jgi:hypothetical protein
MNRKRNILAKYRPCGLTPIVQDLVVIRQPPHLSTLPSPSRSIERYLRAIDLRQREPAANNADGRTDEKPQTEEGERQDRRRRLPPRAWPGGTLENITDVDLWFVNMLSFIYFFLPLI